MVTDHIRKRLRIQNEQSPGGPHKSEVKERILLHSQLLFVSYLVHRYYLCPILFTDTTCVLSRSQILLVSYLVHIYYLCPISNAKTEGQNKITNTKSVFKVSQIDSVKGSAFIQNWDRARIWSSRRVLSSTQNTLQQSESAFSNSEHCTAVRECFHQLKTLYSLIEENHQLHRYSQYHWHNSTLGNIVIYSKYNEAHIRICTQTSIHIIMFTCIHTHKCMHAHMMRSKKGHKKSSYTGQILFKKVNYKD